jgi:RNA polymerase primary sigma factor
LIKAAQRFDETRGFKFISYAVRWIRQSILQALAEQARIVRLPLNKTMSINKIHKTISLLEQEFQRLPTERELAEALDIPESEIKESMRISNRHLSVDAPTSNDESNPDTLLDMYQPEDIVTTDHGLYIEDLRNNIRRVLTTL